MTPDQYLNIRDEFQIQLWDHPEGKKGILVHADKGRAEFLDRTLAEVLRLMDGSRTTRDIASELDQRYGGPTASAGSIVDAVVAQFVRENVVQVASTASLPREFPPPMVSKYRLSILQLQVTSRCNLKCLHCYADSGEALPAELSTSNILSLIDEFSNLGGVRLFLTGGEPLLHPDLDQIIAHAKKRSLFVYLSTNGYALTTARVEQLSALGVGAVNVSIDGSNAQTHDRLRGIDGAYQRAMGAIDSLLAAGILCASHTTLFKGNLDQSIDIVDTLRPKGVADCFFVRMMPRGRAQDRFDLIPTMEEYRVSREAEIRNRRVRYGENIFARRNVALRDKRARCSAGIGQMYVTAEGRCYPCPSLESSELFLGAYPDSSLSRIWNADHGPLDDIRGFRPYEIEQCKNCEFRSVCRGGCAGSAFSVTGSWRNADPHFCVINQIRSRVQQLVPANAGCGANTGDL